MTEINLQSRIKGAIFGVAVADALGAPVEFCRRGSFPRVTDFQRNFNFGLSAGAWTDDTSMTLCLAQSLAAKGFSPVHQLRAYMAWYNDGYMSSIGRCFDIGNLTRQALSFWEHPLSEAAKTGSEVDIDGLQQELNKTYKLKIFCGNGSLMRTVPIGLYFYKSSVEELKNYSHQASQLTHPYLANGEACAVYSILVASILSTNADKSALFDILKNFEFSDPDLKSRFSVYQALEDFEARDESLISSSGYVIHSLEAALWAFFTTDTWEEGGLKVVNLGDDADTVGAIYGGIAGAYYGLEAIPKKWRDGLLENTLVEKVADDLYKSIVEGQGQA